MADYFFKRQYQGRLKAVVFDWAGTTMDFGCMSPVAAFLKVFEQYNVPITLEEARVPMGLHKKDHIRELTQLPSVKERFVAQYSRDPEEGDIEKMFAEFVPLQLEVLKGFSELIPGCLEILRELRSRNYKIGSSTGYNTEMMAIVAQQAKEQGYSPDHIVCASEVPEGRPSPFMVFENLAQLGVYPVEACVKIDDTTPGIDEGLNAGCWTIGLTVSGNEVGLPLADWNSLSEAKQNELRSKAAFKHRQAGAHYVVDTIQDIMPCLDDIEERLRRGEKP